MRTLLLVSMLALSLGLTALSLITVRLTLNRQIQHDLTSDLQHSVDTFHNLERQRRGSLGHESALLADLPSLKALMTTEDDRTIQDGGKEFWQISGMDLLQLYDRSGRLVAYYGHDKVDAVPSATRETLPAILQPKEAMTVMVGSALYEVVAEPLFFGPRNGGTLLGYVVLGSSINRPVAREVSQVAEAKVAFTVDGAIAVTTLPEPLPFDTAALQHLVTGKVTKITLGKERYLAVSMPLSRADVPAGKQVQLVVLRSYEDATHLVLIINRWLLGLGALSLVLGTIIATSVSRRVTRPLEALVDGARALGRGDFSYQLASGGTAEIRELTQAFDHMRLELERSQRALIDSERLATIGRMASSISHDLRHYLSAMYANAEFLSLATTPQVEREELIFQVQTAVHGMTDLLDSLLGFSQSGRALTLTFESLPYLIERAVILLRAHPEAGSLDLSLDHLPDVEAWVDATKFVRAIFNLLLNACQAANRGTETPSVTLDLTQSEEWIAIRIQDNGPGVPATLAGTIFEPFVSRGRENGTGLGLTLALHIAQEHGGLVQLEESAPGKTVFSLQLNQPALRLLHTAQPGVHTVELQVNERRSHP